MTTRFGKVVLGVAWIVTVVAVSAATAQPLGVFRWQTQPYCNVLTLSVVQQGPAFTLHGTDDLCGAAQLAPVTGTAALNPNGSISLGFAVVTPAGPAAHLSAVVSLAGVSGTWHDADGNTGAFLFNGPGGGAARPAPRTAAVITSAQLAASIFAGTGLATTLARSDHTHDDRYFTKAQSTAEIAAASEAIVGPGLNLPATLTSQGAYGGIDETVTTTQAGHLLISKMVLAEIDCLGLGQWFYLLVDGVPLRSSVVFSAGAWTGQITGVTPGVVTAGSHTITVGAECYARSEYQGSYGNTAVTSSSVVVIP